MPSRFPEYDLLWKGTDGRRPAPLGPSQDPASRRARECLAALPAWLRLVLFSLAFFTCAEIGWALSCQETSYVNFWLPAGLFLAVLLLNHTRSWPWLILAAFPANFLFDLRHGTTVLSALGFFTANSVEAVSGAWLVRRFIVERPTLVTLPEFLRFTACTVVVSPMLGAIVGATVLLGNAVESSYLHAWLVWSVGEGMSVLLVTPFILIWCSRTGMGRGLIDSPWKILEGAFLAAGLVAGAWYILVADQGIFAPYKARMVLFLIWAGLRFGTRGATAANLLLGLVMIYFTVHYQKGLTVEQVSSGAYAITLYSYLAMAALVALIPAIAVEERDGMVAVLRDSQARQVLAMDLALIAQWEYDVGSRRFTFNENFYRLLRTTAAQEGGLQMTIEEYARRFLPPEEMPLVAAETERALATTDPHYTRQLQHRFLRRDGTTGVMSVRIAVVKDAAGRTVRTYGANQDITEITQAEQALRLSEVRFRSAMQHSPIGMAIVAPDGRWLEVNPALCTIVGYPREELFDLDFQAITHPDDLGSDLDYVRQMLDRQIESYQLEKRYRHKRGHVVWTQLNVSLVWNPDGTPRHFVSQIQDITARRRAEQALQDNRAKLALAMDMAKLAHWEYDVATDRYISDENAFGLYGTTSEQQGGNAVSSDQYIRKFVAPVDQAMVAEEMARALGTPDPHYSRQFEQRIVRGDGSIGVVMTRCAIVKDATGRTIRICGANQDITEQKRAEEQRRELEGQLRRSQKLEAVGTLAGGIAHDFNNILAGVMGNLQLACMDLATDHPVQPFLQEAEKASRRGRDLVRRILTFSQRREQHREVAALGPVVREALGLLRASLPATIEIRPELEGDGPSVLCDITEIHELIMNLGINAAAAIGERGGLLEVSLSRGVPDRALLEVHPQVGRQHTVCLTVRDNGCGMDAAVLERIFEPFFTTKPAGEGTGLGLAMVHGIMLDHQGAIVVASTPGVGTTFRLFFPEAAGPAPEPELESVPAGVQPSHPAIRGLGERVLVVDDDRAVLTVAAGILRRCGYQPEAFSNPAEALAAFQREPAAYEAIVTDLTMPEMTGLELARSLVALKPKFPVIIASGHLFPEIVEEARELGATRFLQKPYDFKDLAAELVFALGKPADSARPVS